MFLRYFKLYRCNELVTVLKSKENWPCFALVSVESSVPTNTVIKPNSINVIPISHTPILSEHSCCILITIAFHFSNSPESITIFLHFNYSIPFVKSFLIFVKSLLK